MTTNAVNVDPNKPGAMKQSTSALGITKVGRGHKWRLAREMKDVFSRNIARESSSNGIEWLTGDSPLGVCQTRRPGTYGPQSVKPLACHHLGWKISGL